MVEDVGEGAALFDDSEKEAAGVVDGGFVLGENEEGAALGIDAGSRPEVYLSPREMVRRMWTPSCIWLAARVWRRASMISSRLGRPW